MRQVQALGKELQSHTRHDARRDCKHDSIYLLTRRHVVSPRHLEPQGRHAGAERLTNAAEQGAPEHGFPSAPESKIEGKSHGEAFGDVVDEESEEDGEAEFWVCVVGGEGDEAFWELVKSYGDGCLETDGEKGVCWDVMVVGLGGIMGGTGRRRRRNGSTPFAAFEIGVGGGIRGM